LIFAALSKRLTTNYIKTLARQYDIESTPCPQKHFPVINRKRNLTSRFPVRVFLLSHTHPSSTNCLYHFRIVLLQAPLLQKDLTIVTFRPFKPTTMANEIQTTDAIIVFVTGAHGGHLREVFPVKVLLYLN
ncbi:hypothetical protein L9F63_003065, partial [Diploptera punctata]